MPGSRRAPRLRRHAVADSDDLCQSVLGSFLVRVAAGEYELTAAADLERLLVTMVRNKVAALARNESAGRRNHARLWLLDSGEDLSGDSLDDPARQVAGRDLLAQVRARPGADDRALLDHRQQGRSWDEIAALVGGSVVVLRKRWSARFRPWPRNSVWSSTMSEPHDALPDQTVDQTGGWDQSPSVAAAGVAEVLVRQEREWDGGARPSRNCSPRTPRSPTTPTPCWSWCATR